MKTRYIPLIILFALVLAACGAIGGTPTPETEPLPTPQAAAASVTSTTYLNVRSGPGTNYPILFVAAPNTTGEAMGINQDGSWYAVKVPNSTSGDGIGWVSGQYVTTQNVEGLPVIQAPPPPPTVPVPTPQPTSISGTTTEPVNVRSGPSSQYPSYGSIPRGTTVTVTGASEDGSWYQIAVPTDISPDGTGWISGRYVTLSEENVPVQPAPTQPPNVQPSPPQSGSVIAIARDSANVRSGPSNQYPSYGKVTIGASSTAIGQSSDGRWIVVALPTNIAPDGRGWIVSNAVSLEPADAILTLPVIPAP
jgi:uncharacterized protein YraI